MATPLLTTKLYIPPIRPELVPRPRLIERLNAGLSRKLTLISAPPGFGKTTLVSEWIASRELQAHVAWVSLDEGDNDPARFLAYVISALQTIEPNLGKSALDALQSPQPPATEELVAALINEIDSISGTIVLVLDDFHLITAQPIHDAVTFLLDHPPRNLHQVIATRSDPPLPIARLRARGQLTELRQTDLRFTPDEAAEFLKQVMQVELSVNDVAALTFRTEGWIAGLQMAAVSAQGRDDLANFVAAFTGSQHYILDYLIEEVFQRQPEAVQAFLLQTSILDRMCAPLCDAVMSSSLVRVGASQTMLDRLEHANLFVFPLDDHQRWYRYHRLFADLLQARLQQQVGAQGVASLHNRASVWYEENDLVDEAIEHALAAQDFDRAAGLIGQVAEATLMRSQVATLSNWIGLLPDKALHAQPRLHIYKAAALLLSGRSPDAVEAILRDAERADPGGSIAGQVTALRALAAAYQGDAPRAAALARHALELLPKDDLFLRGFAIGSLGLSYLWGDNLDAAVQTLEEGARIGEKTGNVMFTVLALRRVGRLRMAQGKLHEAKSLFEHALELSVDRQGRRLPIAGMALIGLGYLHREWNDLETATRYLTEGIELAQKTSEAMIVGAYLALARVKQAQGDEVAAREAMLKSQRLAAKTESSAMDDLGVALSRAILAIDQGDLGAATAWAESRGLNQGMTALVQEANDDSLAGAVRRYEMLALAKLMMALARAGDALMLLDPILSRAEHEGRIETVIQIQIYRSLALQAQGDATQALAALERALTLAEPSGYIRTFVDEGEPMARLLHQAAERGIAPEYVCKLLSAFRPTTPTDTVQSTIRNRKFEIIEPLSERELEVLRLLAADLSSPEIAQQLYLAVNTVRSHVKSIYGKLDVHSRYEAIVRARELRLL